MPELVAVRVEYYRSIGERDPTGAAYDAVAQEVSRRTGENVSASTIRAWCEEHRKKQRSGRA
ncbi:MAG: hypothetical protein AAFX81_16460 [Pseudomonadota bacterium]